MAYAKRLIGDSGEKGKGFANSDLEREVFFRRERVRSLIYGLGISQVEFMANSIRGKVADPKLQELLDAIDDKIDSKNY